MIKQLSKNKLEFSKNLRKHPTIWESKLWEHLRKRNLGVRFKRQVVIGDYIVDLSCFAKKIIIEIDGKNHRKTNLNNKDAEKENYLIRQGYRILRIWNSEIDKDINCVLEKIIEALKF